MIKSDIDPIINVITIETYTYDMYLHPTKFAVGFSCNRMSDYGTINF